MKRLEFDTGFFGPRRRALFAAPKCYEPVIALVVAVGLSGDPTTVGFAVAFVVIDTVDLMSRRRLSHVFQEVIELSPSLADGNASAAVMSVI